MDHLSPTQSPNASPRVSQEGSRLLSQHSQETNYDDEVLVALQISKTVERNSSEETRRRSIDEMPTVGVPPAQVQRGVDADTEDSSTSDSTENAMIVIDDNRRIQNTDLQNQLRWGMICGVLVSAPFGTVAALSTGHARTFGAIMSGIAGAIALFSFVRRIRLQYQ